MSLSGHSKIRDIDFGDGDRAWGVELPTKPFDSALFATDDLSADSKALLLEIVGWWDSLWPEMLDRLQDGISGYETNQKLGADEFIGALSRTDEDCFMGDKSDIFLRLEFQEPPLWDYFLRDGEIVHFQPVF